MKQRALTQVLSGLVEECGYQTVRRALEKIQPQSPSATTAVAKAAAARRPKKKRARPDAVAVVASLNEADSEKKISLERLARKYEQKVFMPDVAQARDFLRECGVDASRIKMRQNATVRVFKCLADLPQDKLLEIENKGRYGVPKTATDIADAIHAFGNRRRKALRES